MSLPLTTQNERVASKHRICMNVYMHIVVMKTGEVLDEYVLDEFRVSNNQHWLRKLEHSAILMSIQLPEIIVVFILFKLDWQHTAMCSLYSEKYKVPYHITVASLCRPT